MSNFQDKVNFIWSVADEVLRDDFKRGKYPDVILPFTVLRRLDPEPLYKDRAAFEQIDAEILDMLAAVTVMGGTHLTEGVYS